jgi:hypothetical protein
MRTIYPSVFMKPEVVNELRRLYDNFVLIPAEKASNNIVFVCLFNELGFISTSENTTYTRTNLTKDEILQNHLSVLILSTFQQIKQVTTLSSFVKTTLTNAFQMN